MRLTSVEADLRAANLGLADLHKALLNGADLSTRTTDLHEADLRWTDFSGANLSQADLTFVDLQNAIMIEANLNLAILYGANLSHANLQEAKLRVALLTGADLSQADLSSADLTDEVDLSGAILIGADIRKAHLQGANLNGAKLNGANFSDADLFGAKLCDTDLCGVNFSRASLNAANLTGSILEGATLVETNFENANLTGSRIYGISAWNLKLGTEKENNLAIQENLIVTSQDEPVITVDNLEVAQFVYLLLKNEKIRDVIDTITSKVVLILGRFSPERKEILDALREELRNRNYSPVLFDFEKPASRDLTETISTLAHMARFIIADITDAKSIPQELQAIVPDLPSVPVQPLLENSYREYAMFEHFKRYPWVLETYYYNSIEEVLASLKEKIINPAEKKSVEIREKSSRN